MAKGKRKGFDDDFFNEDDLFRQAGESDSVESLLEQFSTYESIEVGITSGKILERAKNLVQSITTQYLNKLSDDDYRDSLIDIESNNLAALMKQVKYAEHLVDTMMRRLDNAGYMDKQIFKEIRYLQLHVLELTKEVSVYTRQLPEYFKFIEADTTSKNKNDYDDYQNQTMIPQQPIQRLEHGTTEDVMVLMTTPQRGTRDLMLALNDSLTDIDNKLSDMPDIELDYDPSEINDDDWVDENDLDDDGGEFFDDDDE